MGVKGAEAIDSGLMWPLVGVTGFDSALPPPQHEEDGGGAAGVGVAMGVCGIDEVL